MRLAPCSLTLFFSSVSIPSIQVNVFRAEIYRQRTLLQKTSQSLLFRSMFSEAATGLTRLALEASQSPRNRVMVSDLAPCSLLLDPVFFFRLNPFYSGQCFPSKIKNQGGIKMRKSQSLLFRSMFSEFFYYRHTNWLFLCRLNPFYSGQCFPSEGNELTEAEYTESQSLLFRSMFSENVNGVDVHLLKKVSIPSIQVNVFRVCVVFISARMIKSLNPFYSGQCFPREDNWAHD
uniref:Uncharacterized protein n=1 Tax=uncultured Desulfobacterium sp. TaxID=201089 RepID=E1YJ05_9BACT|nr:unknown protein [uncultured Desulfobacterium sp.]